MICTFFSGFIVLRLQAVYSEKMESGQQFLLSFQIVLLLYNATGLLQIDGLCYAEICSFHSQFIWSFYHESMWNFVRGPLCYQLRSLCGQFISFLSCFRQRGLYKCTSQSETCYVNHADLNSQKFTYQPLLPGCQDFFFF